MPGANHPDLMIRDGAGTRKAVDGSVTDAGKVKAFLASPQGDMVAVLLAHENATSVTVFDAATAAPLAGPLASEGAIAGWSDDGRTLYFTSREAGQFRLMAWIPPSKPVTAQTFDADVVSLAMRHGETFFLSGRNAPVHRLQAVQTGKPQSAASELMAFPPSLRLESVHAAADGIYVLARDGSHAWIIRIPAKANGRVQSLVPPKSVSRCRNCRSLPAQWAPRISNVAVPDGSISAVLADPQTLGLSIILERHGAEPEALRFDTGTGHFVSEQTKPLM
jgi:hypothetical protein